jgi:hypothetical protein
MKKSLKIGVIVTALALIDLISPPPLVWVSDLIMLVALVRLTRRDGKPKRDHIVGGFPGGTVSVHTMECFGKLCILQYGGLGNVSRPFAGITGSQQH